MGSEQDPLLPRNKGAPEINYGYSVGEIEAHNTEQQNDIHDDEVTRGTSPPIRAFVTLFTIVVGLGLLVSFFVPGGSSFPWDKYPKNETLSTKMRAEKILSENPLIGNTSIWNWWSLISNTVQMDTMTLR